MASCRIRSSGDLGVCVELAQNKGKGLFAKKNFAEDEIIFEEDPLIGCQFSWNQDYGYQACDHCMRPLESAEQNIRRLCQDPTLARPHSRDESVHKIQCICGVSYCSPECQDIAYSMYHKALCAPPDDEKTAQLKSLREIWKNIHYPPETATIMLLIRIYALVHQAEDKAVIVSQLQDFVSATSSEDNKKYLRILKTEHIEVLRDSVMSCVQHLELDAPPELLTSESFLSLIAIIATNGQGVGTSAFSQWVSNVENDTALSSNEREQLDKFIQDTYTRLEEVVGLDFLNNEGSALYSLQSKINHSCLPNVEVTFPHNNHTLALKALRDILPGEELCSSYLDVCMLSRSRHSRQAFLGENYLFTCLCSKCEEQAADPDVTSDEDDDDDMSD